MKLQVLFFLVIYLNIHHSRRKNGIHFKTIIHDDIKKNILMRKNRKNLLFNEY